MGSLVYGIMLLGGAAAGAAGITWTVLASRALMGAGGLCSTVASAATPCPANMLTLMGLVAVGTLVAIGIHMAGARRLDAPSLGGILWSGLFIGLAWSVYEYGAVHSGSAVEYPYLFTAAILLMLGVMPLLVLFTGALLGLFGPDDRDIFARSEPPVARRAIAQPAGAGHIWTPAAVPADTRDAR